MTNTLMWVYSISVSWQLCPLLSDAQTSVQVLFTLYDNFIVFFNKMLTAITPTETLEGRYGWGAKKLTLKLPRARKRPKFLNTAQRLRFPEPH